MLQTSSPFPRWKWCPSCGGQIHCCSWCETLRRGSRFYLQLMFPKRGITQVHTCKYDYLLGVFIRCVLTVQAERRFFNVILLSTPPIKTYKIPNYNTLCFVVWNRKSAQAMISKEDDLCLLWFSCFSQKKFSKDKWTKKHKGLMGYKWLMLAKHASRTNISIITTHQLSSHHHHHLSLTAHRRRNIRSVGGSCHKQLKTWCPTERCYTFCWFKFVFSCSYS